MKKLHAAVLLSGLLLIFLFSCQKEASDNTIPEGQQRIRIRMSDGPVNYDAVNVDIQRVEVLVAPDSCRNRSNEDDDDDDDRGGRGGGDCHYDNDHDDDDYSCMIWDTLDIRPGIYNLLDLSNGADTLLASGITVAGKIKKIRLTLGTQNSVVIDSVQYPLRLWNNYNRITINVRGEDIEEIRPGDLQIWLDFDAGRSIVRIQNNQFILKSFLRIWLPPQTAAIKGKILPDRADAVVSVIANNDTLVAFPNSDGRFKIRGIRGTTADVYINATANGYRDTTLTGVAIQTGRETDIGTIQLRN
ncbi:MAG: DUF4382 domain-containing protein [Chitinophagaceae bacterium]|nr:DUF4382 domain-containing protein [Chitinophagaceae bacterium]